MATASIPHDASCIHPTRHRPRPLVDGTRRVELARTLAADGTPYLAVLIRKPLADREIELLETFLDMLDPGHSYVYQPRNKAA